MKKEKYTYEDVIIDPNDERVKRGEKYYMGGTPKEVLESANEANDFFINTLIEIGNVKCWYPFEGENQRVYCCLIKPKAIQDGYVPYDLSKKEVREKLRGKWIEKRGKVLEEVLFTFDQDYTGCFKCNGYTAEELLGMFTFSDGTPCGEKVEE